MVLFSWLATFAVCLASEPERAKGLTVHMLPERVARIEHRSAGFTLGERESAYSEPADLVSYFKTLPASKQENGLWVVTSHPRSYSSAEREKLRALIALCREKEITIFTCRGSELPTGWKRGDIPSGWNEVSDER